jgi:arylsulfatase A-like enzyme
LAERYAAEHAREHLLATGAAYTTCLPDDAYCDNWVAENGLTFLRGFPANQPWHLVVNFTGPHEPMDVTASMRARWEHVELPPPHACPTAGDPNVARARQNYAAMIENIDRHVGRFIEAVRARGEIDRTLIVYSSDHGEMLGDHGRWGKSTWREASAGIPLIVAGPGVRRGSTTDALVSLHDLAATFLDLARCPPLPYADAISLRGVLEGRSAHHRDVVLSGLNAWRMAVDERYKVVTGVEGGPLLFDLLSDPLEDHNVAAKHPDVAARLTKAIEREQGKT